MIPVTHCVEYATRRRRGLPALAICGAWTDARDISAQPTCPQCYALLHTTAEEMFGGPEPERATS